MALSMAISCVTSELARVNGNARVKIEQRRALLNDRARASPRLHRIFDEELNQRNNHGWYPDTPTAESVAFKNSVRKAIQSLLTGEFNPEAEIGQGEILVKLTEAHEHPVLQAMAARALSNGQVEVMDYSSGIDAAAVTSKALADGRQVAALTAAESVIADERNGRRLLADADRAAVTKTLSQFGPVLKEKGSGVITLDYDTTSNEIFVEQAKAAAAARENVNGENCGRVQITATSGSAKNNSRDPVLGTYELTGHQTFWDSGATPYRRKKTFGSSLDLFLYRAPPPRPEWAVGTFKQMMQNEPLAYSGIYGETPEGAWSEKYIAYCFDKISKRPSRPKRGATTTTTTPDPFDEPEPGEEAEILITTDKLLRTMGSIGGIKDSLDTMTRLYDWKPKATNEKVEKARELFQLKGELSPRSHAYVGVEPPAYAIRHRVKRASGRRIQAEDDITIIGDEEEELSNSAMAADEQLVLLPASPANVTAPKNRKLTPAEAAQVQFGQNGANEFTAYACLTPSGSRMVTEPSERQCQKAGTSLISNKPDIEYYVLQKSDRIRIKVFTCELKRTQIPAYCGAYDHMTIDTDNIYFSKPIHIPATKCRLMQSRPEMKIKYRRYDEPPTYSNPYPLKINATTQLQYESTGDSFFWEDFMGNNKQVSCQGAKWQQPTTGIVIPNMVVATTDDVTLMEEEAEVQADGKILLLKSRRLLPATCNKADGHCVTNDLTVVWSPPAPSNTCHLYKLRAVKGEEIVIAQGRERTRIFADKDQAVRFILKARAHFPECGVRGWTTDFDDLVLVDRKKFDRSKKAKSRVAPLPPSFINVDLNNLVRASFVYGSNQQSLFEFYQEILYNICKDNQMAAQADYAARAANQHARNERVMVSLGKGGRFAVPAGEVWREFYCPTVVAYGRNSDKCYDALPIRLDPVEEKRFLDAELAAGRSHEELKDGLFLQPTTRIITTRAREIECLPHLAPVYENRLASYVAATPVLAITQDPASLKWSTPNPPKSQFWDLLGPSWQRTGLYTLKQLQSFREYLQAAQITQVTDSYFHNIAQSARNAEEFFHGVMGASGIDNPADVARLAGSWVLNKLAMYGLYAVAAVLIIYLLKSILSCWSCGHRLAYPTPKYRNCFAKLFVALCPTVAWTLFETFHSSGRRRRRRHRHEARRKDRRFPIPEPPPYLELAELNPPAGLASSPPVKEVNDVEEAPTVQSPFFFRRHPSLPDPPILRGAMHGAPPSHDLEGEIPNVPLPMDSFKGLPTLRSLAEIREEREKEIEEKNKPSVYIRAPSPQPPSPALSELRETLRDTVDQVCRACDQIVYDSGAGKESETEVSKGEPEKKTTIVNKEDESVAEKSLEREKERK